MRIKYKLHKDITVNSSYEGENHLVKSIEDCIVNYFDNNGIGPYYVDAITFAPEAQEIALGVYNTEKTIEGEVVLGDIEIVLIDYIDEDIVVYTLDHRDGIDEHFTIDNELLELVEAYNKFTQ